MSTKTSFKRIALVAVTALTLGGFSAVSAHAASNAVATSASGVVLTSSPVAGAPVKILVNMKGFFTGPDTSTSYDFAMFSWASIPVTSKLTSQPVASVPSADELLAAGVTAYGPTPTTVSAANQTATVVGNATGAAGIGAFSQYALVTFTPDVAGTWGLEILNPDKASFYNYQVYVTVAASAAITASTTTLTQAVVGSNAYTDGLGNYYASKSAPATLTSGTAATTITAALTNGVGAANTVVGGNAPAITATVSGPAVVSWNGTTWGSSLSNTAGVTANPVLYVAATGVAGLATVSFSYTNSAGTVVSLGSSNITFYGSVAKITTTVYHASIPASATATWFSTDPNGLIHVLKAVATDSSGNVVPNAHLYVTSANTSVISDVNTEATTVTGATGKAYFDLTGAYAGTTTVKVANATSTAATGYVVSEASAPITVASSTPASVKLSWDKDSYLPGEAATLKIAVLDKNGLSVADGVYADIFAAGGLSSNFALSQFADSMYTAGGISAALAQTTVAVEGGFASDSVNMPVTPGTVVLTATGGSNLSAANVAGTITSASATVGADNSAAQAATDAAQEATDAANAAYDAANNAMDSADAATAAAQDASDNASAALAAVTSLSATVAKLVKSVTAIATALASINKKLGVK